MVRRSQIKLDTPESKARLMREVAANLADRPKLDTVAPIAETDPAKRRRELNAAIFFERRRRVSGVSEIHRNEYGRRFVATITTPDADDASLSLARWLNHSKRLLFTIESEVANESGTKIWIQHIDDDQDTTDAMHDLYEIGLSLGLSIQFDAIAKPIDDRPDPLAEIEAMLRDDDRNEHE